MSRIESVRAKAAQWVLGFLVLCAITIAALAPKGAGAVLNPPPGGPILVITSPTSTFGDFYGEILRNEGLNEFAVADIGSVTATTLASYDIVVLAKAALTPAQVTMFTNWVNGGGNLIAMAPDAQLAPLLGLAATGTTLPEAYLLINTATSPGAGLVNQTIQYHGSADRYTLNGASSVATLYSNASTATTNPAVSLRGAGSGTASAFAYDLATSVVYSRQGNPAWAAQERDGFAPIRSDDKFFGNAASDAKPDWIDLSKVAIPQADEQQRLLANLILHVNQAKKPLPRFWYFPNGKKAVVVMTGDDHGNGGTAGRFDQLAAASPAGCSVADWECLRGTSYIYASTPMTDAQASAYNAAGFEVGVHITTGCNDYTAATLQAGYASQINEWQAKYASLPAPVTQRHHCIVWSDWATGAQVQLANGMRLDTSYYFWPPGWVGNVPGLFTGSAMPMRFSGLTGGLIDVYQATTQMTDESGQTYPFTVDSLLDRALGAQGYYGAYVVNAHTDLATIPEATSVIASAKARGVPVVSSRQMMTWLDGRNSSSFGSFTWSGSALGFTISAGPVTNGIQAMLPMRSGTAILGSIARSGSPVAFTAQTIKGIDYAFFSGIGGAYVANYAVDTTAPTVTSKAPAAGATGMGTDAVVTATFSEVMNAATINTNTFELRNAANALVTATVSWDAATRTARLTPTSALAASTTYTAIVKGGPGSPRAEDLVGNPAVGTSWSFATGTGASGPNCPCSGWPSTATPGTPSVNDPGAVELGVKFRTDINGFITGVRFYKGTGNTGTHVGNLWTTSGQLLASAVFTGETATGWQQVTFANPVQVVANTVYVASYYAPNGNYAGDSNFFASNGVDNAPVHLLQNGVSGGNGVYQYGPASSFPSSTFSASNYWVDVVFTTQGPIDTTPPTVTATTPINGATAVPLNGSVTATFSESVDPSTVSASTFELRSSSNALVQASIAYDASTRTATLTPTNQLTASATFTATLRGGATDPRVKDIVGNAMATNASWSFTTGLASGVCAAPANAIVAENCRPGQPASSWDISGAGDPTIQGYAAQFSVNRGTTVQFKVDTTASSYRFDIYRMGYYGGTGARLVTSVLPSASLPQGQPSCLNDASTGLLDCGNWAVSGSWAVPATATSGVYFAKLVRADNGGASHIFFIVRDDASTSNLLFQTSDTTWQAYNNYGGNSLYTGSPAGRAYKVSYNRPFNTRAVDGGQDWVFNSEYPMVRWLEANGYDVSYFSGIDSDRSGSLIQQHRLFLSVGHDEYWSGTQRINVEAARNAGVNLAFFSGNEVFWKTRWENSMDGSGTPYRTLVTYKETHANAKIDPNAAWTGTWRDPRFSPPADGGRPENALTGTIFMANDTGVEYSIVVPEADGKMRLWRNTTVATLASGLSATLPVGTLGYEWDAELDNGFRPPGLVRLSSTTLTIGGVLQDYGSTYGSGTLNHALTLYKHSSGARIFGAGTIQWSWGLDSNHDRGSTAADARMQQATVNLFADMNSQPGSLQAGLVAATPSADVTAPTSSITSPAVAANVIVNTAVAISGTATDAGGGVVGGVEVSVDGGTTWRRATGRASWSYSWTPTAIGTVTIRSRAADDSGNLEAPAAGRSVNVVSAVDVTPPTITSRSPASGATGFSRTANITVTFSESMDATTVNGSTFELRDPSNALVSAVVSYNATTRVATLNPNPTLLALTTYTARVRGGATDPRAKDAAGNALAADSTWSFTTVADTTPPTVTAIVPASGATGVAATTTVRATFSEDMDPATINTNTVQLTAPGGALVPATVTYAAATLIATLTPSSTLAAFTVYTATVRGGTTDPRVKDQAGNALATTRTWNFRTQ
jgi:hypothetical protein